MGIYESQRKVAGSIHLLTIDSFGLHDTFQHNVLSDDITNFSTDGRNSQLKYKLLRDFWHQLSDLDAIFMLIDFLPFVSKHFRYFDTFDQPLGDAPDVENDFTCNKRYYSSKGIAKSFIKSS